MSARPGLIPVGIILFFGILVIREGDRGSFDTAEEMFGQWLAANSRRQAASFPSSRPVLLVEASDETRKDSWPLSLLDHAAFLRAAAGLNPALIALADPPDARSAGAIELRALESAALAVSQLLVVQLHDPGPPAIDPPGCPVLAAESAQEAAPPGGADLLGPARPGSLAETLPAIAATGPWLFRSPLARPALPQAVPEAPLLFATPSGFVPSFILRGVLLASHIAPGEALVLPGRRVLLGDLFAIPVTPDGKTPVPNPLKSGFRRIELGNFLLAAQQPPASRPPELAGLGGGIILLGRTDEASRLIPAGGGQRISNAELFAAAFAQLDPMRPQGRRAPWVSWVILACACALFIKLRSADKGIAAVIGILVAAAYPIAAIAFYEHAFLILPFVPAYALLACLLICRFVLHTPRGQRPRKTARA